MREAILTFLEKNSRIDLQELAVILGTDEESGSEDIAHYYATEPYDGKPTQELMDTNIPVDWEKCYKERDSIRTLFQENVTVE